MHQHDEYLKRFKDRIAILSLNAAATSDRYTVERLAAVLEQELEFIETTYGPAARREAERSIGIREDGRHDLLDISNVEFRPKGSFASYADAERDVLSKLATANEAQSEEEITMSQPPNHETKQQNVPSSERLIAEAIKGEYTYGKLGLILGLATIVGGCILCLNGVVGSASWTAQLLNLKSEVNDAAPGVILFIVGIFMLLVTKPRVRMKDLRG